MRRLRVLTGDKYVIGMRCGEVVRKLFQIIPASDGSLYVAFPYSPFERGRVGILTMPKGPDQSVIIEDFPLTTHHVKYAHHPSGMAHFSQTGRVRNTIRKASVPLNKISGHIFSVTFQGIDRYEPVDLNSNAKRNRGIVAFPFEGHGAYKFVAHIHTERQLARMTAGAGNALWLNCVTPSGKLVKGITFTTKVRCAEGSRYILLYAEPEEKTCAEYDEFLTFLGGFDPPEISLNRAHPTRALMFIYPEKGCTAELLRKVGTVDLL
jgi:hypothetical protein